MMGSIYISIFTILVYVAILVHGDKGNDLNTRPIIGIVSQKVTVEFTPKITSSSSYIAASYVKYLEMCGARTVPILSTYSKKRVLYLMRRVNGVLFPGGASPLHDSNYARVTKIIFKEAKKMNDKGIYFPIWGTCLGFEMLNILASEDETYNVLSKFNAENMALPVNFTIEAFRSRLFHDFDMKTIRGLMFKNMSIHTHKFGISPDIYQSSPSLRKFFKILGVNNDFDGKQFVSIIEGIDYPFYGTQFHPEKNIYEWTPKLSINHCPEAITSAQEFGNFFVNEARKNKQKFDTIDDAVKELMFHYMPVYSGGKSLFEQVYIFNKNSPDKNTLVRNGEI